MSSKKNPIKQVQESITAPEETKEQELTTAEQYYIEQHVDSLSVEDIAHDLNLPVELVEQYVTDLNDETVPKEPRMFERSIGRKRHGNSSALVMTEGASEQIDEIHKQNANKRLPGYVFQPKNVRQRRTR